MQFKIITTKSAISIEPSHEDDSYSDTIILQAILGDYQSPKIDVLMQRFAHEFTGEKRRAHFCQRNQDLFLMVSHYNLIVDVDPVQQKLKRALWANLEHFPTNITGARSRIKDIFHKIYKSTIGDSFKLCMQAYQVEILNAASNSCFYSKKVRQQKKLSQVAQVKVFENIKFLRAQTTSKCSMPHNQYIKIIAYSGPYYYQSPGKYLDYYQEKLRIFTPYGLPLLYLDPQSPECFQIVKQVENIKTWFQEWRQWQEIQAISPWSLNFYTQLSPLKRIFIDTLIVGTIASELIYSHSLLNIFNGQYACVFLRQQLEVYSIASMSHSIPGIVHPKLYPRIEVVLGNPYHWVKTKLQDWYYQRQEQKTIKEYKQWLNTNQQKQKSHGKDNVAIPLHGGRMPPPPQKNGANKCNSK